MSGFLFLNRTVYLAAPKKDRIVSTSVSAFGPELGKKLYKVVLPSYLQQAGGFGKSLCLRTKNSNLPFEEILFQIFKMLFILCVWILGLHVCLSTISVQCPGGKQRD